MRWNALSSECVQLWSGNNLTGNAEEERFPLDSTNNFTCREINSIVHKSHTNRTNRFVVHRLFSFFSSTLSSHHSFTTLQLQVDHNVRTVVNFLRCLIDQEETISYWFLFTPYVPSGAFLYTPFHRELEYFWLVLDTGLLWLVFTWKLNSLCLLLFAAKWKC